jgi:hypothetical protein
VTLKYTFSHFHRVLEAIVSPEFRDHYLRLPDRSTETSPYIVNSPKFSPFFNDARGALDGTQIGTCPPDDVRKGRFRNRKGYLSTNVQAVVDFEQQYIYLLTGWEGSASDSAIFNVARRLDLSIPPGTYLLADAGYPSCDVFLVPYRGIRYHLREWGEAGERQVIFIGCTSILLTFILQPKGLFRAF